ncbi:MAG: bile acid:sodium symporter family protein [Spirochaetaceae bacterium]|jgi:predicted Na+-dependent transporter|nr:bile acid:sodium symporter family protein [Spirochaetaceae bacterium]
MSIQKTPADIAAVCNRQLERFMPVLTPMGVAFGFIFPMIFIRLRPFIPLLFSVMTLSGSLKLQVKDLGGAVANPFPLFIFFLSAHVVIPALAFFICTLLFKGDPDIISGYVLLFSAPTAVSGFIWISIYRGDTALGLTIIFLDTILTPAVVPGTASVLLGTQVALDVTGVAISLILMVVIPTIIGVAVNEISRGKTPALISPYLNPFAKLCIVLVIAANASAVAPRVHLADPKVWGIAGLCVFFAALSYTCSKLTCILCRLSPEKRITLFFATGLRNLSAATTIAIEYFPDAAALPALLGIVFQQSLAAIMGKLFNRKISPATAQP